jgi:hypothetical protein
MTDPPDAPDTPEPPSQVAASSRTGLWIGLGALLLIVVVGAAAYIVLKPKGPYAFSGGLTVPDTCAGAQGLQIQAVAKAAGATAGSGPVALKDQDGGCRLTFAFDLDRADSYDLALEMSESGRSGTFEGPSFTAAELETAGGAMDFPLSDFPELAKLAGGAQAADAQSQLRNALAAAKVYFVDSDSYDGLTPDALEQIEPSLTYNDSTTVTPGEVSIRDVSTTTVVLVAESDAGEVFCIADDATQGTTFGTTDAQATADCAELAWPT